MSQNQTLTQETQTASRTPLAQLQEILHLLGFVSEHVPVQPEVPYEQVLVELLPPDESDLPAGLVMLMFFMEDALRGAPDIELASNAPSTLQFMLEFAYDFSALSTGRLSDALYLCNALSQIVPIGHFGLSPGKKLFYRYGLMGPSQNMDGQVIAQVLEMLSFFIGGIAPQFASLLASEKSAEQILTESGFMQVLQGSAPH